jgi:hypothetical protein
MPGFLTELKRRNVIRMGGLYLVGGGCLYKWREKCPIH